MTAALEWSYNPWRERPGRSLGALVAVLGCCALVSSLGLPAGVAIALSAGIGASFGPAILPWSYRVDESGVTLGRGVLSQRRGWTEIRRAVRSPEGVLLSPFERRHWLEAYRAFFLPLPSRASSRLAEDVEHILAQHGL